MKKNRVLEGPLAFELARFGAPLALGMALQTTFNLVDAYLVAQLPIDEVKPAVGAMGICDQVAALGTIVSYGVSTAAGAILSKRKGANDQAGIQNAAWQSMIIVAALSAFLAIVGIAGAPLIVRGIIGAKGNVAEIATSYLRVSVGGGFSIFFLLQLTNVQRSLGSSKTPVALLVFGNAINVPIAVLLMFGAGPAPHLLQWATPIAAALHIPRMGMLGAAWASVIARSIVLLPNIVILIRRFDVFPKNKRPDPPELVRILSIAWPSSAQFFLRIIAMLVVSTLVARYFTTEQDQDATTAMGLVFRLDTMALFVAMGWGSAAQTFVGQALGAQKQTRAKQAGWITSAYDGVTNVLLIGAVYTWGEPILRVFGGEGRPLAIAVSYLHVVAPSYLALGFGIVLGNAMAGAGATRTTFAIDAVVITLLELPLCLIVVGALKSSITSLFSCVVVTNFASAVAYAAVYARGTWVRASERT